MGPTLVSYLRGVGGTVVATTTATMAGIAGALWLAAAVETVGGGAATAAAETMGGGAAMATAAIGGGAAATVVAVSGLRLDPPVGGGEEWRTRHLKLCPPHVLAIPGLEKGRR